MERNVGDEKKIASFLAATIPMTTDYLRHCLRLKGWKFKEKGAGLYRAFHIKSNKTGIEGEFHIYNLVLDIVTIDRHKQPLKFDEGVLDFNYFFKKATENINLRLRVITRLLEQKDTNQAIEQVTKEAQKCGDWMRIWKLGKEKGR